MSSKLFLIFIIFFAVGAFAGSFFVPSKSYVSGLPFCLGLFFIFLALFLLALRSLGGAGVLVIVLLGLGAGLCWYAFRAAPPDVSVLEKQVGQRIVLKGIIDDEPDERENYIGLAVKTEGGAKILVLARHYPIFKYGDEVETVGVLQKPSNFSDFDYRAYLAKDNIYFEMFYPEVKLVSSGRGWSVQEKLFLLKEKFLENISRVIPEPQSALLGGLTFGAKRSMPEDLLEDFRRTGIIHIVVLSGYNVTIIADAIMRVFSFLPSFMGIGLGALGIIGFALMAGASATVVRASLMALLVLLARATGRIYEITIALFAAGFLMVLHNPKIIRFDSSFQLSFLATMALIYLAPMMEKRFKFLPKKFQIRAIIAATASTQIFVLPLILYKMGLFSTVALPVNLLVLFFIPATMFFGFLTAATGFTSIILGTSISYFLSLPFAWITHLLLSYELKIVELFSALPFASFNIPNFPLWLMLLVYGVYTILIFRFKIFKSK
ncbi:ComEC family competence protein [Patescibacteria group bacterium]|nr:ComEC family competence protein [Patescibacteria group bacterium]